MSVADRNFNNNQVNRNYNDGNDTYQDRVVEDDEEGVLFFQDCIMKPPKDPGLLNNFYAKFIIQIFFKLYDM